jgi:hypothetical protein
MIRLRTFGLFLLTLLFLGCTHYPEVSSPESLKLIAALRTACSSKKTDRLDKVEKAVEKAKQDNKLSASTNPSSALYKRPGAEIGTGRSGRVWPFRKPRCAETDSDLSGLCYYLG